MKKVGTQVELDLTKVLKMLDKTFVALGQQSKVWDDWLNVVRKALPTLDSVESMLGKVTGRLNQLKFTEEGATEVGKQEIAVRRKQITVLREIRNEYREQARAAEKSSHEAEQAAKKEVRAADAAAKAQERHTKATGAGLKKMLLWGIGAASAYRLFMKLRRATMEFVTEVIKGTAEQDRLTAANKQLRAAMAAAFGPDILEAVEYISSAVGKLTGHVTDLAVQMEVNRRIQEIAAESTNAHAQYMILMGGSAEIVAEKTGLNVDIQKLYADALNTVNRRIDEFNAKAKEQEKSIESMITLSQAWTDATTKHNIAAREITQTYLTNVKVIQGQYYDKLYKADMRYNKAVDKINADALDAREDVWAGYYKKIESLRKAVRTRERQDAERHALEMMFARRRFDLTMLQNERMYQYQRGLLIGEGDVLAIEDLDARYTLEQQAQEENFALQMEQAEAMYRLQARYQREANREQIALLRDTLNEQLQEIEEARREQLAEAEDAHTEERSEAAAWAGEQMVDELKNQQDQLKANDKYLADMRKKTAEGLAKIAKEHNLAWDDVYGVWSSTVGPDGNMDKLGKDFYDRQATLARSFGDAWIQQINLIRQSAAAGVYLPITTRGYGGRGGLPSGHPQYRQYGGDDVVSTPTTFMAGERGQAERVIVQPLSPIGGGALTLGWQGSAIPVHGTGQLEGMDLSGLGDAISQGLVASMRKSVLGYKGQRGS